MQTLHEIHHYFVMRGVWSGPSSPCFGSIFFALLPIVTNSDSQSSNMQSLEEDGWFYIRGGECSSGSTQPPALLKSLQKCWRSWSSSKLVSSCAAGQKRANNTTCGSSHVKHMGNVRWWKECRLISQHTIGSFLYIFFQLPRHYRANLQKIWRHSGPVVWKKNTFGAAEKTTQRWRQAKTGRGHQFGSFCPA